jgi:trk system potassium uptake protein TrkH
MNDQNKMQQGNMIANKPRQKDMAPLSFDVRDRSFTSSSFSSPFLLVVIFGAVIILGAVLLMLPMSHHGDGINDPVIAFFTATSAVTVTGLTVVETSSYWSIFGKCVILFLMFIGGLGFMAMAAFLMALLGQRISTAQKLLIRESLNTDKLGGIQRLSVLIVVSAIAIQIVGFVFLLVRFLFLYPFNEAVWQAVFHAVSAYNNAGIVIFPEVDGFKHHGGDFITLGIIMWLIFLGSISFWVIADLATKRTFTLYRLATKITLVATIALILFSTLLFMSSEFSNPNTIGNMNLLEKMGISVFESISGRTAGFTTINYSQVNPATHIFMSFMMFIGGATGSVSGGIKVATLFVIVLSVIALIKEKSHVTIFDREIDPITIRQSYAVFVICLAFVFTSTLLLALTNNHVSVKDLAFESFSAFGTVGLSTGITPELNTIGKIIIMATMFIGRIGPLVIGLRMIPVGQTDSYRYANETVTIG